MPRVSLPPGVQGYFLMQEDMKDFVTSKPTAGVCLRFSWVTSPNSVWTVSLKRFESYVDGGGDGGLSGGPTYKMMTSKRTLGMSLAPEVTSGTCTQLHGAGTLKSLLQKGSGFVSRGAQS